jgi:hypothetical protein
LPAIRCVLVGDVPPSQGKREPPICSTRRRPGGGDVGRPDSVVMHASDSSAHSRWATQPGYRGGGNKVVGQVSSWRCPDRAGSGPGPVPRPGRDDGGPPPLLAAPFQAPGSCGALPGPRRASAGRPAASRSWRLRGAGPGGSCGHRPGTAPRSHLELRRERPAATRLLPLHGLHDEHPSVRGVTPDGECPSNRRKPSRLCAACHCADSATWHLALRPRHGTFSGNSTVQNPATRMLAPRARRRDRPAMGTKILHGRGVEFSVAVRGHGERCRWRRRERSRPCPPLPPLPAPPSPGTG